MQDSKRNELQESKEAQAIVGKTVSRRQFLKYAGITGVTVGMGAGLGGLVAACGGTTETTETTGGAAALDTFNVKMEAEWAKLIAPIDVSAILPESVAPVVPGKHIVEVALTMAADSCATMAATHKWCCETLGWNYTLIDSGGDPSKMSDGMDKAISMKADGVVSFAIDPSIIPEAIARLAAAGIPYGGSGNYDEGEVNKHAFDTFPEKIYISEGYAEGIAAYMLTAKKVKAITMSIEDGVYSRHRIKGFEDFCAEAKAAGADVEIVDQEKFVVADQPNAVPGLAAAAVQKVPDYTCIVLGADSTGDYARSGLQAAGLLDTSKVMVGNNGTAPFVQDMRAGGISKATVGTPLYYHATAAIDDMNRIFAGEKPLGPNRLKKQPTWYWAVPRMMVIKENAKEGTGPWDEYMLKPLQEGYKKLWGV